MALYGQRDILLHIASEFNRFEIPYLLTGSFAVAYYGVPRATHDIDFIVEIEKKETSSFTSLLKDLSSEFITDTDMESNHFANLFHAGTGTKIDFWFLQNNPFEKSKFSRKKRVMFEDTTVFIIAAEDLILTKLLWCKETRSERHFEDCKGIVRIQKTLDNKYLDKWAKILAIEVFLKKIYTEALTQQ